MTGAVFDWESCPEYATPVPPATVYELAARVRALFES